MRSAEDEAVVAELLAYAQQRYGAVHPSFVFDPPEITDEIDPLTLIADDVCDAFLSHLLPAHLLPNSDIIAIIAVDPTTDEIRRYLAHDDIDAFVADRDAFISSVETLPAWLDFELIDRAQRLFWQKIPDILYALAFASLFSGFVVPRINETMIATGAMAGQLTLRRLVETTSMVTAVMESVHCLRVGGKGWMAVVRVRCLHGAVRIKLKRRGFGQAKIGTQGDSDVASGGLCPMRTDSARESSFDSDTTQTNLDNAQATYTEQSCPFSVDPAVASKDKDDVKIINQADQNATLLSFQIVVLADIAKYSTLTSQQVSDYTHLWRYIGYLLGIDEKTNPCIDVPTSMESIMTYLVRHARPTHPTGARLASNLLKALGKGDEVAMGRQVECARMSSPMCDVFGIPPSVFSTRLRLLTFRMVARWMWSIGFIVYCWWVGTEVGRRTVVERVERICVRIGGDIEFRMSKNKKTVPETGIKVERDVKEVI